MDSTARFAELVGRPEDAIPLDEAALLLAAHGDPGLDVADQLRRLDALAGDCPSATLEGLCSHLFDDLGFRGDPERYHDPRSSYLHEVVERRRGIPISLSVVVIEVGRRLGVPVVGIGMPGHFLVRFEGVDKEPYLDAFGGGTRLDVAGCAELFGRLGQASAFTPQFLEAVGTRAILSRMLANLQGIFLSGDLRSAAWVVTLRRLIPGLAPPQRLDIARALAALGRFDVAADELERLAAESPTEAAAKLARQARSLRARTN